MDDSLVLRLMLAAGLGVALSGALACLVISILRRRKRLLAHGPLPGPAWNGTHVLFAIAAFLAFGVCLGVVQSALASAGLFHRLYGPDFPLDMPRDPTDAHRAAATIRHLWASAVFFPFQFAALLLLPRVLAVGNPMHTRGWSGAAVAGYLTWLIVTPAALCVFVIAGIANRELTGLNPERHPLTMLGDLATHRELRILFVLQTVLIAPVVEEWLFRGVLLPWLAQREPAPPSAPFTVPPNHRPLLVLFAAVAIGTAFSMGDDGSQWLTQVRSGLADDRRTAIAYLLPAAFLLLLVPVHFLIPHLLRRRPDQPERSPQDARAIWASAALFAAVHAHVWPSPVPLLVLAVGLGYLYLRTRSLVGPIVVHSLFNSVSATYVLIAGPG